jgi:hypothetical protein
LDELAKNDGRKKSKYTPLLLRKKEETLEEKVKNLGEKKRKIYEAKFSKREGLGATSIVGMDDEIDEDE